MRTEWAALLMILSLPMFALVEARAEEKTRDNVRTLEAIEIEGELAIPQVLFITSRDHPRHRDGLRERYRNSALEIGRETVFPRRFRPLAGHPQPQK
ncbi:hypothetical protein DRQ32_07710 [bacterium]|nr:MAG: hypothetical protein DRQ32_07710 [bacterium]